MKKKINAKTIEKKINLNQHEYAAIKTYKEKKLLFIRFFASFVNWFFFFFCFSDAYGISNEFLPAALVKKHLQLS